MRTLFLLVTIFLPLLCRGAATQPPELHVDGNRLKTGKGKIVRLHGVNVASLEWSSRGENVLKSISEVTGHWNANCIRLPLSQDRWFGKAPEQKDEGAAYRKLVQDAVTL